MVKPHFSFWIIAGLGLVWNLMGCMNFVQQMNADVVAQMPEAYQEIILARPLWATVAFGVGVLAGAVGCVFLLLRWRRSMQVLLVSLVAVAVTAAQVVMAASGGTASTLVALLVAALLFWYATIAARVGWLR